MMLVSMVQSSREKQQEILWTQVKVLLGGRLITEYQRCPSLKSFDVFMKNKLLRKKSNESSFMNNKLAIDEHRICDLIAYIL